MSARRPPKSAPPSSQDGSDELSFEAALERLEGIVDQLEAGELELEAALAAFEQGVALARGCSTQLGAAERRIEVLVKEGASWGERPFDAPEEVE